MPNFMLQDILYSLLALILLPLFILTPGYVIGWAADVLNFRKRRFLTRLLLGITLSVAIVPAFTYLFARITQIKIMWWIFLPFWIIFFWLIIPELRRLHFPQDRWVRWAFGFTLLWVSLAILSLIDLQSGKELFFNVVAFDWSHRVAITDAIARTGIPPVNPFFFTGEPVFISYYYLWSIIPALLTQLTGGIITSRIAFLASAIWCGISLRAVAALYLRFQEPGGKQKISQRSAAANFLFLVTGLDILFIAVLLSQIPLSPVISEWWNGNSQITAWSGVTFWASNHAASLIACLTGIILFQSITPDLSQPKRLLIIVIIAISLTSAIGMSFYVALVFFVFYGIWFLSSLFITEMRFKATLFIFTGLLVIFFISPFLFDTLKYRSNLDAGTNILSFSIRPFILIENNSLLQNAIGSYFLRNLIRLLLLPVNYFIELGFFMLAGFLYLLSSYQDRHARKFLRVDLLLLLTGLFICSFIMSSIIENNDLGWRGFLPAQFILLIWSANLVTEVFTKWFGSQESGTPLRISRVVCLSLILTLTIGLASSLFDLLNLRFFMVMHDKQVWLTSRGGTYPARDYGHDVLSLRQAYQFIKEELPQDWRIQNNPIVPNIDISQGLYANRQAVVSGPGATTYGLSFLVYQQVVDQIAPVFMDQSISSEKVRQICTKLAFDIVIVTDIDPVWNEPESWVWQNQPNFQTENVRLFECPLIQ